MLFVSQAAFRGGATSLPGQPHDVYLRRHRGIGCHGDLEKGKVIYLEECYFVISLDFTSFSSKNNNNLCKYPQISARISIAS